MPLLASIALSAALFPQAGPDPLRLTIGRAGEITLNPGTMANTRTSQPARPNDVAVAARGTRFVFLGESHDRLAHHQMQAAVIEALVADGRDVIVGFEMFTRPVQQALNPWTLGWWSEQEFIAKADWKGQWGFDFALYRPIFEATRKHRLPMVALNVPRDWVRRVGRQGPAGLTEAERAQVPPIDTANPEHRMIFNALMGGHPMTGPGGENIYAAQCLWDGAMADSAIKFLAARPVTSKTVMVVVAGSGHVMYGQAINRHVRLRTGDPGITVMMAESKEPATVSRGIGDFIYLSAP